MDSYSLGVVFFACVTRVEPEEGVDYLRRVNTDTAISIPHNVLLNMLLWADPKVRSRTKEILFQLQTHSLTEETSAAVNRPSSIDFHINHVCVVGGGENDDDDDDDDDEENEIDVCT
ncbi:uncharacterized protein LOC106011332 [Aplysia californica]|uniref:Uncharacterized protein LOC106011332 n=1 Tax=Aplysia californica TaxID=6500 RepID=A0ABM0ZWL1_APLCA|nr:uncharacterized protein LOC106011332 [Aplysia californica]